MPTGKADYKQAGTFLYVPMDDILPNPWQVASEARMADAKIRELADSIREVGLQQIPVARPVPMLDGSAGAFQLAFGHRRTAAIKLLIAEGVWTEPGMPLVIKPLTDAAMAIAALTENRDREPVPPMDEYRAIKRMMEEIPTLSITEIARQLHVDRSTLSNGLRSSSCGCRRHGCPSPPAAATAPPWTPWTP